LTELVAIVHMRERFENKIRTHCLSPYSSNPCTGEISVDRPCSRGEPLQSRATPNCRFHLLDAPYTPPNSKSWWRLHL
jgi:hypothetical protein